MSILLFFLLAVSGCKTAKPVVNEPDFITYPQDNPHQWISEEMVGSTKRILVEKVYEKSWDIDYVLAHCDKRSRKKYKPKVVDAINRAVSLWLSPIIQHQKIVDHQKPPPELVNNLNIRQKKKLFLYENKFQEGYTTFDTDELVKLRKDLADKFSEIPDKNTIQQYEEFQKYEQYLLKLPEISVVFNCRKGRAFMTPYYNSMNIYEADSKTTIPETPFPFEALLHEIGHAFGLADTYVESTDPTRAHIVSTDVNLKTVGHQPITIMGPLYQLSFTSYEDVRPTADDDNGISWLYTYIHISKFNLARCPPRYQAEFFEREKQGNPTVACRPSHPFLFAMRSRNYSTAKFLLNNDKSSIDINARAYDQGFTAIHYAVWFAPIDLIKAILQRFHEKIDFSIAGSHRGEKPVWTVLGWAEFLLKDAQQKNMLQGVKRYSAIIDLLLSYDGVS